MNKDELLADLEVIFQRELFELKTRETFNPEMDNRYPHLDYLIKIYLDIENNDDLKHPFISYIFPKLHESKEYFRDRIHTPYSICRLSFVFLLQIDSYENAIRGLKIRADRNMGYHSIIDFIPALFKYYNPKFSSVQLQTLNKLVTNHRPGSSVRGISKALKAIHDKRFNILKDKIDFQNIEINRDKQEVIKKIDKIGINDDINKFFYDLEDYIISGKPQDYAGKIAVFRNVMCDFYIDLAKIISNIAGEQIPDYSHINKSMQEIGKSKYYIKDKLELTDNEHKFINAFVSILQEEGGHSFGSEKEYLRLSKNIAIEIILFILTKYEEKFG